MLLAGPAFCAVMPADALTLKKFQIDPSRSKLEVAVFKEGFLSAFGHNHEIVATQYHGFVEIDAEKIDHSKVQIEVETDSLEVRDRDVSQNDRQSITSDMKGPKVLDVAKYPAVQFTSTGVAGIQRNGQTVKLSLLGKLTVHGTTRDIMLPLTVEMGADQLIARGTTTIKQTDYGITPIRVALGGVKVKDQVQISFEIIALAR